MAGSALEITDDFIPFESWLNRVPRPDDAAQFRRMEFYEYYQTKFKLARAARPKAICEIGVRWGYSAFSLLAAAPAASYRGFDIVAGRHGGVRNTDTFGYVRDFLEQHFPHARIELVHADTRALDSLGGPYDLIHIDGDHTEAGCRHDLELALSACVAGGTILVDDYDYIAGVTRAADGFCQAFAGQIAERRCEHSLRGELILTKGASHD